MEVIMKANKPLGVVMGIIIGMAIIISCTNPLSSNTAASGKYQVSTTDIGAYIYVTIINTDNGAITSQEQYHWEDYKRVAAN